MRIVLNSFYSFDLIYVINLLVEWFKELYSVLLTEVMGALLSVLLIWVVTGVLVYMAVQRVITEDYEIDATVMLITAALSVVFNLV